jgi:hypothetical protein
MAQRNIDFGSFPNDPDADAIRTAFEKVQLNFTELFSGLQDQAVLSVNRTPGQGVTVNSPTGNVVVNANIACVTVTTTTLSLGLNSANGNLVTTLDNSTTQSLTIDLPSNIAGPNNANFIGTVTANAFVANNSISSSNTITATGNLSAGNISTSGRLTVTGNITSGNANLGNLATANFFAGTLTTAAQPNITTVGTLANLAVAGNSNLGNSANANFFVGNGIFLTSVVAAPSNVVINGTSQVFVTLNGNVTTRVASADIVTVSSLGANTTGYGNFTGNLSAANANLGNAVAANFFIGTFYGAANTATSATTAGTVTTAAQPNITSVGTLTGLGVNGTVTAAAFTANTGIFTGNGSGLSQLAGANVTGTVPSATSATSATTAGTVTTAAQPNITSVGTLSALTITGNLSSGNANLGNLVRANFIQGDGSLLTNIAVGAGSFIINGNSEVRVDANSNVRISVSGNTNIVTVTGTGANIAGYANVTGNLSAGNISTGLMTGTLSVASNAQPNITSLGTLTSLTVNGVSNLGSNSNVIITGGVANSFLRTNGSGSLVWDTATLVPAQGTNTQVIFNDGGSTYAGNANLTFDKTTGVLSAHGLTVTNTGTFGNVFANSGTVRGNLLTGTLTTNAQPNITSTGTLISLIVGGNINAGNVSGGNLVSANFFAGSGANLANLPGANVTGTVPNATAANTLLTNTSASTTAFPMFATSSANGYSQNFVQPGISANLANNSITATTFVGALSGTASSATTAGTVTTNAQPNITSTGTLTSLIVGGNVNAGNVYANSGTIGASLLTGTVTTNAQPNVTSVGTLTGLGVNGTVTAVNITANTGVFAGSGANLTSLNASNVSSGTLAQARLANASVTLGSTALTLGSTVTTVAGLTSVTSTTFVGALSGAATTAGTVTTAAQPNITSVGTLTGLTLANASVISVGSNTNVGTFTGNFSLSAGSRLNATYADIAEKYVADDTYAPGTVLMFGGEFEVTLANAFDSTRVAGVVTTNPAYSMNSALEAEFIAEIALQGRVPCKVQGPVEKGDLMVSATDGHATANNNARAGTIIGKALEHFSGEFGIIEVAVGRF